MRFAPECEQRFDAGRDTGADVRLAGVAGVGEQRGGRAEGLGQRTQGLEHGHELALVVARLGQAGGEHQHRVGVDRGLRVVALLKAPARCRHDARVRIGEIDLVAGLGTALRRARRLAAGFLAGAPGVVLARGELGLVLGLFGCQALGGARFDFSLRLRDGLQACLAPPQLLGNIQPLGQWLRIGALGARQQLLDLGQQLRLELLGMPVRQRAVARGVGVQLRAVQCQRAELEQLHRLGDEQHLHEQRLDLGEESLAERAQRVVIGVAVGRNVAKCQRLVGRRLDAPARIGPARIAVDEQREQHRRVIGRRACAAIGAGHARQVELIDNLDHEPRQMTLGQPVFNRRRQQIQCRPITGAKMTHDSPLPLVCSSVRIFELRKSSRLSPTGC